MRFDSELEDGGFSEKKRYVRKWTRQRLRRDEKERLKFAVVVQ